MNKKILIRMALGLFAIAALMAGYNWFKDFSKDPNRAVKIESTGMIAALEMTRDGSQAVVFTADGKTLTPQTPEGKSVEDRQVEWSGSGNALYFSSNRESSAFNVFRWDPVNARLEKRSNSQRSLSTPVFGPIGVEDMDTGGLLMAGGQVLSYDPKEQTMRQVLPPSGMGPMSSDEEGGSVSAMQAVYDKFGTSFRQAAWGVNRQFIYAIMRRDAGEVLLIQPVMNGGGAASSQPIPIIAGDRINLSVAANGSAIFSVVNFQFIDPSNPGPEFVKDGKVTKPFKHAVIALMGLEQRGEQLVPLSQLITAFGDDKALISDVALSPDGTQFVAVMGEVQDQVNFVPLGMVIAPVAERGLDQGSPLKQGRVSQPAWSPDGSKVVYLISEGKGRSIFTINRDGSGEVRISPEGKDYSGPKFSPQTKAAAE